MQQFFLLWQHLLAKIETRSKPPLVDVELFFLLYILFFFDIKQSIFLKSFQQNHQTSCMRVHAFQDGTLKF